jgi:hypothetical protein
VAVAHCLHLVSARHAQQTLQHNAAPFDTVSAGCFGADYYQRVELLSRRTPGGRPPTPDGCACVRGGCRSGPVAGLSPWQLLSLVLLQGSTLVTIYPVYSFL